MSGRRSPYLPRRRRVLALAVAPLAAGLAVSATGLPSSANIIVRNVKPGSGASDPVSVPPPLTAAADGPILAYPVTTPINGFQPFVVVGLTDEHDPDEFYSPKAGEPGVQYRSPPNETDPPLTFRPFTPVPNPSQYIVGTLDSGGQSTILSYADTQTVNLFAAGLEGTEQIEVTGAGGDSVFLDVSDALGQYISGLQNATPGANGPVVAQSSLKGIWNNSILTVSDSESPIPTLVGNPIFAHWQVVLRNSQTQRLRIGNQTYQGPQTELRNIDAAHDNSFVRIGLTATSAGGANSFPVFVFNFSNPGGEWSDNPQVPTVWNFMGVKTNVTNEGHEINQSPFLFDTGAQVSVISNETANLLGIQTGGSNPDPPDFTAEVLGVGGVETVNGYYIDSLSLITNGAPLVANNVPVLVLDVSDPLDGVDAVPGILGMNLFNDRDLIINAKYGNSTGSYLAFSEFALPQPKWNVNSGGGNWGDNSKWFRGVPWQAGEVANFTASTTAPQTINVDANDGLGPYAMARINFDSAQRYTLSGPGSLRLEELVGNAAIQVTSGSHTIAVPVQLASTTDLTVIPAASTLTINSVVSSPNGSGVVKTGQGTAEVKRLADIGALDVQAGKLKMLHGTGGAAGTSSVDTLDIATAARLDLTNNNLVIRAGDIGAASGGVYDGVQGQVQRAYNFGAWDQPGLTTSELNAGQNAGPLSGTTTIGVATGEQILFIGADETGVFAGQTVTGASVIAMYTYAGDVNFDGLVDGADYGTLDNWIQFPGTDGYANGDVNYDGVIDGADYGVLDNTIQLQGAPIPGWDSAAPSAVAGLSAVPEPSACGLMIVAVAAAAGGRRRRQFRG